MEYILNITDWNVNLYWHNVLIIGNWTHSQVCSIMLVKTTQYKSSGISSANLLRALEIFDLPPAISPELNKCPGSNPVSIVESYWPMYLMELFSMGPRYQFISTLPVIYAHQHGHSTFFVGRDVRSGSPKWPGAVLYFGVDIILIKHHVINSGCKQAGWSHYQLNWQLSFRQ